MFLKASTVSFLKLKIIILCVWYVRGTSYSTCVKVRGHSFSRFFHSTFTWVSRIKFRLANRLSWQAPVSNEHLQCLTDISNPTRLRRTIVVFLSSNVNKPRICSAWSLSSQSSLGVHRWGLQLSPARAINCLCLVAASGQACSMKLLWVV